MTRNKSGCIVTLGSVVGQTGAEGQIVYAASKSAIVGLTRSAARELAPAGIRVNAVAPGMINTDLLASLSEEKLRERQRAIRMGRFGEPREVANAIVFLCSGYASYITGQVLGVDGGIVV
jgi:3-oxoacyl-[acyl-carrier protein] reductase